MISIGLAIDLDHPMKDTEASIRASYKFAYDCHIVTIEQYKDGRTPEWKVITQLFCGTMEQARELATEITRVGRLRCEVPA